MKQYDIVRNFVTFFSETLLANTIDVIYKRRK